MTSLTIQERQAKVELIATYTLEVLHKATVKELKDLCKGIVSTQGLKKQDLITELMAVSKDQRDLITLQKEQQKIKNAETLLKLQEDQLKLQAAQLETLNAKERSLASRMVIKSVGVDQRSIRIVDKIVGLLASSMTLPEIKDALYGLSSEEVSSDIQRYAGSYIKSLKTDYKKALDTEVEKHQGTRYYRDLVLLVNFYKNTYEKGTSYITIALNEEYAKKVVEKVTNQVSIDPTTLLNYTKAVLAHPDEYRYEDVAIALALATGRRMAEIMSTGNFEVVDEYTIAFSGLTKARFKKDEKSVAVINIPTLVPAKDVVKGIEYLTFLNRRIDIEDVNNKYGKAFLRVIKGHWLNISGLPSSDEKVFTYKSLRALYAEICYKNLGGTVDKSLYYSKILGHDSNDLTTANSYKVWILK